MRTCGYENAEKAPPSEARGARLSRWISVKGES